MSGNRGASVLFTELAGKLDSSERLARVRRALEASGAREAYLTGGAVRDALMGRLSEGCDLDIALPTFDGAFANRFAAALGGSAFMLDDETNAWRVTAPDGEEVDLISYRGTDILEDLRGRDFILNAMAYDMLGGGGVLDPLGGLETISARVIALCGPTALEEDPLRILRAYRFAATLGFDLAPGLPTLLAETAPKLKQVSVERIRYEIFRMTGAQNAAWALRRIVKDGVWKTLFPFIEKWRGFDQGSYHSHDLLEHSLRAVEGVEEAIRSEWFDGVSEKLHTHLAEKLEADITRLALLRWVAFFHDVAKPESLTVEETGRRRFIGHDALGAKTVGHLLLNLKTGRNTAGAAGKIIAAHMRLFGLANQANPTLRSRLRYLRDLGDETPEAVLLSIADELATGDRDQSERQRIWETCAELLRLYFNREEEVEPLIRGRDLVELFGLPEGPLVGMTLAAVADAETGGEVTNREEALEYAGKFLSILGE